MSNFLRSFLKALLTNNETSSLDEGELDLSDQLKNLSTSTETAKNDKKTTKRTSDEKPAHHPAALLLLLQITNLPKVDLCSLLHKTHLLGTENKDYIKIAEYIRNSQEHSFGIELLNIIRVARKNELEFKPKEGEQSPDQFRMMLWHGTKKKCVSSILKNSFSNPQNKKQMFGTGIYFADRASKSAQYCDSTSAGTTGYIFLCDVMLGKIYKAKNPNNDRSRPPTGYNSVKCVGKKIPDWECNKDIKGAILPSGMTKDNTRFTSYTVNFNEYVIYSPERINAKYLVVVRFK